MSAVTVPTGVPVTMMLNESPGSVLLVALPTGCTLSSPLDRVLVVGLLDAFRLMVNVGVTKLSPPGISSAC